MHWPCNLCSVLAGQWYKGLSSDAFVRFSIGTSVVTQHNHATALLRIIVRRVYCVHRRENLCGHPVCANPPGQHLQQLQIFW